MMRGVTRADAPGRVNLIGEHTDHHEGLVLPAAIPLRTTVQLAARDDDRVRIASAGFGEARYRLGEERRAGDWADHVRGVTWVLAGAIRGFEAAVRSDVPAGAGLASSAALEVALLRALRDAFGLAIDDTALALAAHRAETGFVGARVGTMDQLAASLGRDGEALLIDTRTLAVERVPLPPALALVVVHSGIAHAHATGSHRKDRVGGPSRSGRAGLGSYNERRAECDEAARLLGLRALRDATLADVARLPDPLARRARHVVSENERVRELAAALRAGDLVRCGGVMDRSHASLRDDFAVSLPEIDVLRDALRAQPGVYGARMVGGGFGGAVLALASPGAARRAADAGLASYRARTGRAGRVVLPQP